MSRGARRAVSGIFRRRSLEYFVTVAEEGRVSVAAQKLHIAQPALSQAISKLESDVGFELLQRHARGVTLTPAGVVFLEKARLALAAEEDALLTAEALARAQRGAIVIGCIGLPPALLHPGLFAAFAAGHPDVELELQDLPFPTLPTASWLRGVDVAVTTRPAEDPEVLCQPLSAEPRVVLATKDHHLAARRELAVADVLDETFVGFHPSVDPEWAGLWSLDDHRGAPTARLVGKAGTAQERFTCLVSGEGIAVLPRCHASLLVNVLPALSAIPLADAAPTVLALAGRKDRHSSLVGAMFSMARDIAEHGGLVRPVENGLRTHGNATSGAT
jgi:DNA-binding transcriptional LysR family regulator